MQKLTTILLTLLFFFSPIYANVCIASDPLTLWQYYDMKGETLPSLSERGKIYSEIVKFEFYRGTAEQNIVLLEYLLSGGSQQEKTAIENEDMGEFFGGVAGSSELPKISANFESSLVSRIEKTDTSMNLVDSTDQDGNTLSGWYGFIIDISSSKRETVIANCTGSACSSMLRGVSYSDGISTSSDRAFIHGRGADVSITNHPNLTIITNILNGIDGIPDLVYYDSTISTTTIADSSNGSILINRDYAINLANDYGATSTFWILASNLVDIYYKAGRVSVGVADPSIYGSGKITQVSEDGEESDFVNVILSNSGYPVNHLIRARGTIASPLIVMNNDKLGSLTFDAYDGNDYITDGASINSYVDGTPAENYIPGDLRFEASSTERMRIESGGNVGIGTTDPDAKLHIEGNLIYTEDAFFGSGVDGATTTSATTTLDRDYFFTDLTINSNITLYTNGYRIFVRDTMINNGIISRNGNNASGSTGGSALSDGTILGGDAGVNGGGGGNGQALAVGSPGGAGTAGTSVTSSIGEDGIAGTTGGAGGAGESYSGGAGGAGGALGSATDSLMMPYTTTQMVLLHEVINTSVKFYKGNGVTGGSGGGGGGGGRASSSNCEGGNGGNGGGSGSNGGTIAIYAQFFTNNGLINAIGGSGGNGTNGGDATGTGNNCGGGGGGSGGNGGSGGTFVLVYNVFTNNGSIVLLGGSGGNGGSGGLKYGSAPATDGSNGSNGSIGASGNMYLLQK